jgi:septal ring factor EnvC (AmiA/AmiB activator)
MIPEIDVQLAAVIKALGDNVAPALDPANPMAAEQLHLAMVRQRLPDLHANLRRDLAEAIALAGRIGAASGAAEAVLASPESSAQRLESEVRALKEAITARIDAVRGTADEARVARAVMDAAQGPILRWRSWASGMGFEPDPAAVPPLADLLAG